MSFFKGDITIDNANISTLTLNDTLPTDTSNTIYNSNSCITLHNNYLSMFPKSIVSVSSNTYVNIPDNTVGINIKMVGSGGGGGGQGDTTYTDVGGGGGSGSYTEVFLNASTFDASSTYPNRNKIYIDIGSGGGSGGSGTNDGTTGGNTVARFASSANVSGDLIATTFGGTYGYRGSSYGKGGEGGNEGTISIGLGYSIPGQPGQNGIDSGTTESGRLGTIGGDSVLGAGGKVHHYGYIATTDDYTWSDVDTTSGTTWSSPPDDNFISQSLSTSNGFVFYNNTYTTVYLGSNGYLTFNTGDTGLTESLANHFSKLRISFLFDDISPNQGGTVKYYHDTTNHIFTYTFINVPQYNASDQNNCQVRLYLKDHANSGKIEIIYGSVALNDCVVGLSPVTTGTPTDFSATDFSTISTQIVSPYPTQQFTTAFDLDNKIITFHPILMNGIAGGGGGGGTMYDNASGTNGGDGKAIITFY